MHVGSVFRKDQDQSRKIQKKSETCRPFPGNESPAFLSAWPLCLLLQLLTLHSKRTVCYIRIQLHNQWFGQFVRLLRLSVVLILIIHLSLQAAARIILNVFVTGSSLFGKAFIDAWRQAGISKCHNLESFKFHLI